MERRESGRAGTLLDVVFSGGRDEGEGVLADVSSTGALLEDVSVSPPIDSDIQLVVFVEPTRVVELTGVVTRHTGTGFAVRFKQYSSELALLLEQAGDSKL